MRPLLQREQEPCNAALRPPWRFLPILLQYLSTASRSVLESDPQKLAPLFLHLPPAILRLVPPLLVQKRTGEVVTVQQLRVTVWIRLLSRVVATILVPRLLLSATQLQVGLAPILIAFLLLGVQPRGLSLPPALRKILTTKC